MNFGIVGYWGYGRGNASVVLFFAKTLIPTHKVFVFNPVVTPDGKAPYVEDSFKGLDVNVFDNTSGWDIDEKVFRNWIKTFKLNAILFVEYGQWFKPKVDLLQIAKEEGCKRYAFLVNEKFEKSQTDNYDRILCPNMTQVRLMRRHRVRNFTFIPYSIDLNEIKDLKVDKDDKFVFFHPAGMIGVNERKNTRKVIEAFKLLNRDDTKLKIVSQVKFDFGELPENVEIIDKSVQHIELMKYFAEADVTVYPPKWETIGIGILESLSVGTPVITTDFPPMNEYIRPNQSGLLVPIFRNKYKGINIYGADIDVVDLKNRMETSMNEFILQMMSKNAMTVVEELYDLEKNKHYLLDFLENDVGDKK